MSCIFVIWSHLNMGSLGSPVFGHILIITGITRMIAITCQLWWAVDRGSICGKVLVLLSSLLSEGVHSWRSDLSKDEGRRVQLVWGNCLSNPSSLRSAIQHLPYMILTCSSDYAKDFTDFLGRKSHSLDSQTIIVCKRTTLTKLCWALYHDLGFISWSWALDNKFIQCFFICTNFNNNLHLEILVHVQYTNK